LTSNKTRSIVDDGDAKFRLTKPEYSNSLNLNCLLLLLLLLFCSCCFCRCCCCWSCVPGYEVHTDLEPCCRPHQNKLINRFDDIIIFPVGSCHHIYDWRIISL